MTIAVRTAPTTEHFTAAAAAQKLLPELVALALHAKQAHWNVTGPGFLPLHTLTDQLSVDAHAWADGSPNEPSLSASRSTPALQRSPPQPDRSPPAMSATVKSSAN